MSGVTGLARMMRTYVGEAGEWVLRKVSEAERLRGVDGDETEDEEFGGVVGGVGNGGRKGYPSM